ncbi:hypothetical protein L208DRAFT_1306240 [Tricholoma matsutake]|nr:hypothetical protein L208DRAFT_1306240 [Tricholoma matsutake 945]
MSSLNGSFFSLTLAIASANKQSERRLNTFVVKNLAKPGSVVSFHIIQRLSLGSLQAWIPNVPKHSIVQQSCIVFAGPVHRTKKKTKTGLNWTRKDQTRGLFMDWSFILKNIVGPMKNQFQLVFVSMCI